MKATMVQNANRTTATEACAALQKLTMAIGLPASASATKREKKWAFRSWGAHFAKSPSMKRLDAVTRCVGDDVGRIITMVKQSGYAAA